MKRIVSVVLVLAMLLTLPTIAAMAGSSDAVTLSVGKSLNLTKTFADGESYENNAWTKAYLDRFGVKIDFAITTQDSEYNQKIALCIASNDLPDMWVSDKNNLYLAVEAGLLADLTELQANNLSELSHKYVDDYTLPFEACTFDGKLYAFPFLSEDPGNGAGYTFLRHDWLEALGLEQPKTQQELVDDLIAFATKDPDGNGVADTYGLAITKLLWGTAGSMYKLESFFNAYHAYPNIWYEDESGKLVYGTVQAETMKAALSDLHKLYEAGAINPEFIVQDNDKTGESISSLKTGLFYGDWWNIAVAPATSFVNDPDKVTDRWWVIDPVSFDETPAMLQTSSTNPNTFYVVNKNCKNPEKLYDMINLWFENVYGPDQTLEQQQTYVANNEHDPQSYPFVGNLYPYIQPRIAQLKAVIEGTMDPSQLSAEASQIWAGYEAFLKGDYANAAYNYTCYWAHGMQEHASMRVRMDLVARGGILEDKFYGQSTETMVARNSTLEQLRDEAVFQIITGDKPVEYFDEFIANWYALGGQDIVDEVNAWYATTK